MKRVLPDLELELLASPEMRSRVQDRAYAVRLYSALCNMRWKKAGSQPWDELWSCSWRYAGDIVADLRGAGENYLHYYCAGDEGTVAPDIRDHLAALGWSPVPYSDP